MDLPLAKEEYFEIVDLIAAVRSAHGHFTMVEVGAGYGRGLVQGAIALKRINPLPFLLIGIEAEPTHFEWLKTHMADNGIDPDQHVLLRAAASATGEKVSFTVGNPSGWYGQAISTWDPSEFGGTLAMVPGVKLSDVLAPYSHIDLVDMDIQGVELDVVREAIDVIDEKVQRIHIGTHSREIESGLSAVFRERGWVTVWEFPSMATVETDYGAVSFNDGVHSYLNPRFA